MKFMHPDATFFWTYLLKKMTMGTVTAKVKKTNKIGTTIGTRFRFAEK